MKKLLAAIFCTLLFVSAAEASWNVRQNDDGTAEWVQSDGDTHPIGSVYLNIQVTSVNDEATWVVVSPITDAYIDSIRAVLPDYVGGTATLKFYTSDTTTPTLVGSQVTDASVGTLVLDTANEVKTFTPTANRTLQQGQIIYIHNDGSSTSSAGAGITITIKRN